MALTVIEISAEIHLDQANEGFHDDGFYWIVSFEGTTVARGTYSRI